MYGLVNSGIRTFVEQNHGADVWGEICARAGLDTDEFETMESYDDTITLSMVVAASEVLDVSTEKVLQVFGQYWVGFSQSTAIGKLIHQGGQDFWDRLAGLDEMHERIKMTMPDLDPPSFDLEGTADGYRLHYHSSREGLAPMVVGLLHGLAEDCGVEVTVDHIASKSDGAAHDIFALSIVSAAQVA